MITVVLGTVVFVLSVAGLAAGILLGREPLRGSCGGSACLSESDCECCSRHHREKQR
jgi:hypothetical protein